MEAANYFNRNAKRRQWTVNSALFGLHMILAVSVIIFVVSAIYIYSSSAIHVQMQSSASVGPPKTLTLTPGKKNGYHQPSLANQRQPGRGAIAANDNFPPPFQSIMDRAIKFKSFCHNLTTPVRINSTSKEADLPGFGIVDDMNSYEDTEYGYQCSMPPETECTEQKFSIIIMGYGLDRLLLLRKEMKHMLSNKHVRRNQKAVAYDEMIGELIFVWNNPDVRLNSSRVGADLIRLASSTNNPFLENVNTTESNPFRIFYPHNYGIDGGLMNRYHPSIRPKFKALLYYDDDGPFFRYWPINSAFELWKRNANGQIGAQPRAFTLTGRQRNERQELIGETLDDDDDKKFTSHCREHSDVIGYDFTAFSPFGANMVLPSGSFLHSDYLCWLWHPAFERIRQFVRLHSVQPDDIAVSTIVSQLSGRSPLTYDRGLDDEPDPAASSTSRQELGVGERRRLLWKDVSKKSWATRRTHAINSLTAYFGSMNSGSLGWCYKTPFHQKDPNNHIFGICVPESATTIDMLPWMAKGGYQNDKCTV